MAASAAEVWGYGVYEAWHPDNLDAEDGYLDICDIFSFLR